MFDNNRFVCLLNNCMVDENKPFSENYAVIRKNKVERHQLDKHELNENEFFATLMENLVSRKTEW